jgi:hypothetical protein
MVWILLPAEALLLMVEIVIFTLEALHGAKFLN